MKIEPQQFDSRPARLAILNPTCLDVVPQHADYLASLGFEIIASDSFRTLDDDGIARVLSDIDAAIVPAVRRITGAHLAHAGRLKVLSIAARGLDMVDVAAAVQHGVVVTNVSGGMAAEVVADLTLGLTLAVARQIPHHDRLIRAGIHQRGMGVSLCGKILGIIGLGQIGRAVAVRALGFGMKVMASSPDPNPEFLKDYEVEMVGLDHLLRHSDFVSLHAPLSEQTHGMIGPRELSLMKTSAYLVNTARKQLVEEDALVHAIHEGIIAGAALDDPPQGAELLQLPNVVFTPHLGNRAIEGVNDVFRRAIDHAVTVLQGGLPAQVVKDVG